MATFSLGAASDLMNTHLLLRAQKRLRADKRAKGQRILTQMHWSQCFCVLCVQRHGHRAWHGRWLWYAHLEPAQ